MTADPPVAVPHGRPFQIVGALEHRVFAEPFLEPQHGLLQALFLFQTGGVGEKVSLEDALIPPNPDSFGFERNCEFVVDSHAGLTDLFVSQARREVERQPRASVREQLKRVQEKAEKKSPVQAVPKKKEPER